MEKDYTGQLTTLNSTLLIIAKQMIIQNNIAEALALQELKEEGKEDLKANNRQVRTPGLS